MSGINSTSSMNLTALSKIRESVGHLANVEVEGVDFSFITPSLLALGRFPEQKIDELTKVLQRKKVVIWNLSGKPFSAAGKAKLKNQLLDVPWSTPGQFTQAPTLDCLFAQCYAIKSWLDLSNDHVAIVHCANGRSRTGVLIACLMKFMGSCDNASAAFDYFCSARSKSDTKPSLGPSYRILFENIDKTINHGGYPNKKPLHLKRLALTGLPVDEIPCVEVWDAQGLVFNSHNGYKSSNRCTWSSEYGDGVFKVAQDLLGDFSILCRFGGHHAITRDKTTLIFKYQNSTAFLPCEVVELKRQNVDLNPEYMDSVDTECFTVHLMFEPAMRSSGIPALAGSRRPSGNAAMNAAGGAAAAGGAEATAGGPEAIRRLTSTSLRDRPTGDKESFEMGLDEISNFHVVDPEANKSTTLIDMGYPSQYVPVALQLANNSIDTAADLIQGIKSRSLFLKEQAIEQKKSGASRHHSGLTRSNSFDKIKFDGMSYSASGEHASPLRVNNSLAFDAEGDNRRITSLTGSSLNSGSLGEMIPGASTVAAVEVSRHETICPVCKEESSFKLDQLIPCTACRRPYHTGCFGARRLPFNMTSDWPKRLKYVSKYYGEWRCDECVTSGRPSHGPVNMEWMRNVAASGVLPPGVTTRPINIVSTSPRGSAFPTASSPRSPTSPRAVTGSVGIDGPVSQFTFSDTAIANVISPKRMPPSVPGISPTAQQPVVENSREAAFLAMLSRRKGGGVASAAVDDPLKNRLSIGIPTPSAAAGKSGVNTWESNTTTPLTASSSAYPINMESPRADGTPGVPVSSISKENAVFSLTSQSPANRPDSLTPNAAANSPAAHPVSSTVHSAGGSHPQSVVSPSVATKNLMDPRQAMLAMLAQRQQTLGGGTTNVGGGTGSGSASGTGSGSGSGSGSGTGGTGSGGDGTGPGVGSGGDGSGGSGRPTSFGSHSGGHDESHAPHGTPSSRTRKDITVTPSESESKDRRKSFETYTGPKLKDDPLYAKFVRMIQCGLPKASVAQKMVTENVVGNIKEAIEILGSNPEGPVPDLAALAEKLAAKAIKSPEVKRVEPSVEEKPNEPTPKKEPAAEAAAPPLPEDPSKGSDEKVPLGEHPKYMKFFKMLKVGLPKEMVRSKMEQEGVNGSFIDKDPSELVFLDDAKNQEKPVEEKDNGNADVQMIPISEHPVYSKYYRMLKVGLPKTAVQNKMIQEGVDPSFLDHEPDFLIALQPEGPKIAVSEHPKYAKYFKMMKVGLPKEAIKAKMLLEGVNASYLDKEPDEMIPVDEDAVPTAKMPKKSPAGQRKPTVRKKKLHWKPLDPSKLQDSLWADKDTDEIHMDEEEFNQLFVDTSDGKEPKDAKPIDESKKKRIVSVIDMKRAQNGGISLARIKLPFPEIRKMISVMEDSCFSTDQLRSLEEFLPNAEESSALKNYKGDPELLGAAEKYMLVMTDFPSAPMRIQCMIYKQQFSHRVAECKDTLNKIEMACDDVKMSVRLKKVLKTILKVGNSLNDGEEHGGFTLDSLLKLQTAKAFDKKTSVLQYVIMLLYRNDESSLLFPEDLVNVSEASRVTIESVQVESSQLRQGLDSACGVIATIRQEDKQGSTGSMASFLVKATHKCDELDKSIEKIRSKFSSVLDYFGEEPTMLPHDFFQTLSKFIQEFVITRDKVERMRKMEAREAAAKESAAAGVRRRSSVITGTTTPGGIAGAEDVDGGPIAGRVKSLHRGSRRNTTAQLN